MLQSKKPTAVTFNAEGSVLNWFDALYCLPASWERQSFRAAETFPGGTVYDATQQVTWVCWF